MADLCDGELKRYEKQILIDGIGIAGQQKLKNAHVAIVGVGGLGSNVAIQLTAAGIGHLKIIDFDIIDISNLNRQVLYWEEDIGKSKVESAFYKLKKLNPKVNINCVNEKIDSANVGQILHDVQAIVDCSDNFEIRYILNEFSIKHKKPLFHGAVYSFDGRATTIIPDVTPCLQCIYDIQMKEDNIPVIGVAPAIIGSIQATETIRYILGLDIMLKTKLLIFSYENLCYNLIDILKNPTCKVCGLG